MANEIARPGFEPADPKLLINIGALLDIPTGHPLKGKYGETIINGGLGALTGFTGIGNNFKSTEMHYQFITAMLRMWGSKGTNGNSYDTEINVHLSRLKQLCDSNPEYMQALADGLIDDFIDSQAWLVTDKAKHTADEWFDILRKYLYEKRKWDKKQYRQTPFLNRDRTDFYRMLTPTFSEVDSLSEFTTQASLDVIEKNSLGDTKGQTLYMKQGLDRNRFLGEMPGLGGSSVHYTLMTCHMGEKIVMDPYAPQLKTLSALKDGDLKGVPRKFSYLMNNFWYCYNAKPFLNKSTGAPEYPRDADENAAVDSKDLQLVMLRQLRGKAGESGFAVEHLVSQSEGVLASLSEFHYLRNNDYFGLTGNNVNYASAFLPDVKLQRTTVRGRLSESQQLRRAINISSEILQMREFWNYYPDEFYKDPREVVDILKTKNYDLDLLLNTRGWWTLDNDHPTPFLSSVDVLNICKGDYHPYWYDEALKAKKA